MSTPGGRQMFLFTVRLLELYGIFDSIQFQSAKYLLWQARTSEATVFGHFLFVYFLLTPPFDAVTNRIFFISAAFDLPSIFFCFCNTCLFVTFRTFGVAEVVLPSPSATSLTNWLNTDKCFETPCSLGRTEIVVITVVIKKSHHHT